MNKHAKQRARQEKAEFLEEGGGGMKCCYLRMYLLRM